MQKLGLFAAFLTLGSSIGDFALDAPDADLSIDANPLGNSAETKTALRVEGESKEEEEREFLVEFGLTSKTGATASGTPIKDKVTLYTSIVAQNGTGDVWAINPLLHMSEESGSYNAQGIELDFDNQNAHRGDDEGAAGLAPPVAYGLAVTGAGSFRSTAAIAVMGAESQWNRGIVGCANNAVRQATFADYCSEHEASIDLVGSPKWGLRQRSASTRNIFRGRTGIGGLPSDGFALTVGGGTAIIDGGLWTTGSSIRSEGKEASNIRSARKDSHRSPLEAVARLRTTSTTANDAEERVGFGLDPGSVRSVLPELVRSTRTGDGAQTDLISLDGIVALLVEGIQQQQVLIEDLSARLERSEPTAKESSS